MKYVIVDGFDVVPNFPVFDTYEAARAFIKSLGRKYYYLRVFPSDCFIVPN